MDPETSNPPASAIHLWTLGAITVVAFVLASLVHEGLGHGSACLLGGSKALQLNAIYFDCDESRLTPAGLRWLAAGGSIVEALFALGALALLRGRIVRDGRMRYFLWLFSTVSLLAVFGYPLFSGIGNFGDWAVIIQGLRPAWAFRVALIVAGSALYFGLMPPIMMRGLEPFLGRSEPERRARARTLSLIPYLVGGTTEVLAGVLNPQGFLLVVISAAATTFGGVSLLAWYPQSLVRPARPASPAVPLGIGRSVPWMVTAGLVEALFILVLGPGIKFR